MITAQIATRLYLGNVVGMRLADPSCRLVRRHRSLRDSIEEPRRSKVRELRASAAMDDLVRHCGPVFSKSRLSGPLPPALPLAFGHLAVDEKILIRFQSQSHLAQLCSACRNKDEPPTVDGRE